MSLGKTAKMVYGSARDGGAEGADDEVTLIECDATQAGIGKA